MSIKFFKSLNEKQFTKTVFSQFTSCIGHRIEILKLYASPISILNTYCNQFCKFLLLNNGSR